LVKYIALNTLPRRGIQAKPEQILITMGGQNALWMAAQVLLNQRRTAVMENPGYPGLRAALNLARCNVVNVPVDHAGMCLDAVPDGNRCCVHHAKPSLPDECDHAARATAGPSGDGVHGTTS
jgi:DNA-binding transcriptional MocR family regulator